MMFTRKLLSVRRRNDYSTLPGEEREQLCNKLIEAYFLRHAAVDEFDGLTPATRSCRKMNALIMLAQRNADNGNGGSISIMYMYMYLKDYMYLRHCVTCTCTYACTCTCICTPVIFSIVYLSNIITVYALL